jgi:hypothetical protein
VNDYRLQRDSDVALQEIFDRLAAIGAQTKWNNTDIWSGFLRG